MGQKIRGNGFQNIARLVFIYSCYSHTCELELDILFLGSLPIPYECPHTTAAIFLLCDVITDKAHWNHKRRCKYSSVIQVRYGLEIK